MPDGSFLSTRPPIATEYHRPPGGVGPGPGAVRRWPVVALLAVLGIFFGAGCATVPPVSSPVQGAGAMVDHLEERALLLLLTDRRTYDPLTLSRGLDGSSALRRQTAYAVARIGDPRGTSMLEGLLADPAPEVRRAAAFALGIFPGGVGESEVRSLLGAVTDPDRHTGALAVEALGRLGVELETVVERLITVPSDELFPRLLPGLYRFDGPSVVRWAEQGLELDGPALHARAAYALARNPRPEGAPALRTLLADPDPWVRGWAARALGTVGDRGDIPRLRPLLDDAEPGPIVRALGAARRLIGTGQVAAPRDWLPRLLELLADPRPGVRLTALEVAGAWLLDDTLGLALQSFADSPAVRERELALLALAEGGDPRGAALVVRWAGAAEPSLRARVAEAAALYGAEEILATLTVDPDPEVRTAALDMRLASREDEAAAPLALAALVDPDPAVRAAALGWAEEHPLLSVEALGATAEVSRRDRLVGARVAVVGALRARAEATPLERGAAVALLEALAEDDEPAVRRGVAEALVSLDRQPPNPGPLERKPIEVYRVAVQRTRYPMRFEIVTDRGSFRVVLDGEEAPMTSLSFANLAAQGFYDGTVLHRVVPDFVVQGGDPRGDGFGTAGYTLRHEPNLLPYERGVLGMAHSGPDTAGSQFFVTLSPQPHLEGSYVAFGRVVAGDAVLDQLMQGDRIVRIVEEPAP